MTTKIKYLLLVVFSFFCFIGVSYAKDVMPQGVLINGYGSYYNTSALPYTRWLNNVNQNGGHTQFTLELVASTEFSANEQKYVVGKVCSSGFFTASISNYSEEKSAFKNGNLDVINTYQSCVMDAGIKGFVYNVYLKVASWDIPSGGADFLNASSYFNVYSSGQYADMFSFLSFNITDEDKFPADYAAYSALAKDQEIINGQININNNINNVNNNISNMTQVITNRVGDLLSNTNAQFDRLVGMDINDNDKKLPDKSGIDDYNNTEGQLIDKIKDTDMSDLSLGINAKSSSFVWDNMTSFIQSHSKIFAFFIAILSIGVIKLALGR